mmetsp:Transcript_139998/g.447757  ORF Transcript_139998/g.447757 Transcript_139998/m.447757 type:complete len:546 (-) Transcript_139998:11-1648(-)
MPIRLGDLSDEVHKAVFQCLHGHEAAAVAAAGRFVARALGDEDLWKRCAWQEFGPQEGTAKRAGDALHLYRGLHRRGQCLSLRWARVPCQHNLGMRTRSPSVFCSHGFLFVFGGQEPRRETDLHGGPLTMPLVLRRIDIAGAALPSVYDGQVTVLQDDGEPRERSARRRNGASASVRVMVSGGLAAGGSVPHSESDRFGIFEIHISPTGAPRAKWVLAGIMPFPRSGHCATFVPARDRKLTSSKGCVVLTGGSPSHRARCVDMLDLESLYWSSSTPASASGASPPRWRQHSAMYLRSRGRDGTILCCGRSETVGDPDCRWSDRWTACWLEGCGSGAELRSVPAALDVRLSIGGAHVACRLAATDSVLLVGASPPDAPGGGAGGAVGGVVAAAAVRGRLQDVELVGQTVPEDRTFGGCCGLPDGTALFYGGCNDMGRTFDDIWVAHTGPKTDFFLLVQQELSFLTKMQRRVRSLRQNMDDDSSDADVYDDAVPPGSIAPGGASLLAELVADLEASPSEPPPPRGPRTWPSSRGGGGSSSGGSSCEG